MAEMNSLLEKTSLGLAVISLFLTIYFSKDKIFQLIFIVLFGLFLIFYFIYKNALAVKKSAHLINQFNLRIENIEKKLDIYERLNKPEKEVFKNE